MTHNTHTHSDILIIGGGLGGLFTGALLARNGKRVRVLEKNAIIGGGLQCFERRGKIFETGMHILVGMEDGGSVNRLCRYLGIIDDLDIVPLGPSVTDSILCLEDGVKYDIKRGREGFIDSLAAYFPSQREGLTRYVDALYRLTDGVALFNLRPEPRALTLPPEEFLIPADEFIARYVNDARLRNLLGFLSPLYGGMRGVTPTYVHAFINVLYMNGATRFAAGSQQLAVALKGIIEGAGGEVLPGTPATALLTADRHVQHVDTPQGRFTADTYIGAVSPTHLIDISSPGTWGKAFTRRLESLTLSPSAFTLFLDLKDNAVPYINHTCYVTDTLDHIWDQGKDTLQGFPHGLMYMTPPDKDQGPWASRMLVHAVMGWEHVQQWSDSTTGHRPAPYTAWKERCTHSVLDLLEKAMPGIRGNIRHMYAASPLTIRDYYNTPRGCIFGISKDCNNLVASQIPLYTKLDNLLLTGQNINLHGICGVPLTAVGTAQAVLGPDSIINQLTPKTPV